MDTAADIVSTRFSVSKENEQADTGRDRTVKPVSRNQLFRRERGQGNVSLFS